MVYIIKGEGDTYKVGRSKNPNKRLKQLQTANSIPLKIVTTFETEDDTQLEREIHKMLSSHIPGRQQPLSGEWFELSSTWLKTIIFEIRTKLL